MFQFNYTLTENDFFQFNINHQLYTRSGKRTFRVIKYSILCIMIIAITPFLFHDLTDLTDTVIIIATGIFCCIVWLISAKRIVIEQAKSFVRKQIKNNHISLPQGGTLSFEEQFISNVGTLQEGKISYRLIDSIYMTNMAIYIYITPTSAIILPYRFIESQEVFNSLVDFLQEKTNNTIINIVK